MKYLIDKVCPTLIVAAILALVGAIGQVVQPGWCARLIGAVPYDAQIIVGQPGSKLVFSQASAGDGHIQLNRLGEKTYQTWIILRKPKD